MIRSSTPTHKFTFPIETELCARILITYKQGDRIIVEKTESDVVFEGDKAVSVILTQEETLKFDAKQSVKIQVRVLTQNGKSIPSQIFTRRCEDVLNPKVLV